MTGTDARSRGAPIAVVRAFLVHRSKVVCFGIVLAVALPIASVALQITPSTSSLPMAEDFRMWDSQTLAPFRVSDHRGKVVLLDFMATTCDVCRASMADLLTIHGTFEGDVFVLLSVTLFAGDTLATMEAYRREYSANWTFAMPVDAGEVARDYEIAGFPTFVLLDRDGRIAYRAAGLMPVETLLSHIENTIGR